MPPTSVSSTYSGKYTVARVMNNLLATYSIATLNSIPMPVHDTRPHTSFDDLTTASSPVLLPDVRSKRFALRKMWKKTVAVRPRIVRTRTMFCESSKRTNVETTGREREETRKVSFV